MAKKKANKWSIFYGAARRNCSNPTATNQKKLADAEKKYRASAKAKGKSKRDIDKSVSKAKRCKR